MPTRRSFLAATAAIVAVDFMSADSASANSSSATPAPAATPKPPPGPSATARCMAKHLQSSLKEAKLDDALTEKIAGDIDGYLDLGKDFLAKKLRNSDEPDTIFSAIEGFVS
jgi:hypothetical protein